MAGGAVRGGEAAAGSGEERYLYLDCSSMKQQWPLCPAPTSTKDKFASKTPTSTVAATRLIGTKNPTTNTQKPPFAQRVSLEDQGPGKIDKLEGGRERGREG